MFLFVRDFLKPTSPPFWALLVCEMCFCVDSDKFYAPRELRSFFREALWSVRQMLNVIALHTLQSERKCSHTRTIGNCCAFFSPSSSRGRATSSLFSHHNTSESYQLLFFHALVPSSSASLGSRHMYSPRFYCFSCGGTFRVVGKTCRRLFIAS